jgi:mRNA-degrading endonuclease RelE of RelBE toxin-antitoxin system
MAVFRVLRGLLKSDNPLAAHGVKKLKALRGKSLYRNRVSDYRSLFSIDSTPVTQLETEYQGTLTVEAIRHRSRAYRP